MKNSWIQGLPMPDSVDWDPLPDTSGKRTVTGRVVLQRNFYNISTVTFSWGNRLDVEIHELQTDTAVEQRRSHKIEELIRNSSQVEVYGDNPTAEIPTVEGENTSGPTENGVLIAYGVVESGNVQLHEGWPTRFSAQVTVRLYPELPSS
jgi:hypothetical protein